MHPAMDPGELLMARLRASDRLSDFPGDDRRIVVVDGGRAEGRIGRHPLRRATLADLPGLPAGPRAVIVIADCLGGLDAVAPGLRALRHRRPDLPVILLSRGLEAGDTGRAPIALADAALAWPPSPGGIDRALAGLAAANLAWQIQAYNTPLL